VHCLWCCAKVSLVIVVVVVGVVFCILFQKYNFSNCCSFFASLFENTILDIAVVFADLVKMPF
jgi:hypothetical protein